MSPAIIIHGGSWRIPVEEHESHRQGCYRAALAGYEVLAKGGAALDAVETAVVLLEDDPTFFQASPSLQFPKSVNLPGTTQYRS